MTVGYFNKNSLYNRILANQGPAFTLWETTDGKVVPVTITAESHNQFPHEKGLEEVGELKEKIERFTVPEAIELFGRTADEMITAISTYKNAAEIKEILALR